MKFAKQIGIFMAMTLFVGGTVVAQADQLCKNIKFEFKNSHNSGRSVKVVNVEYFDKEDNKWRTENVKDTECSHNATCTTGKEDLEYVGNEDITKVKFHFKYREADGDWSDKVIGGVKKPQYPYCKADKTFRKSPGQPFVIFGS